MNWNVSPDGVTISEATLLSESHTPDLKPDQHM
jgi:hypothetical protein